MVSSPRYVTVSFTYQPPLVDNVDTRPCNKTLTQNIEGVGGVTMNRPHSVSVIKSEGRKRNFQDLEVDSPNVK